MISLAEKSCHCKFSTQGVAMQPIKVKKYKQNNPIVGSSAGKQVLAKPK